MIINISLDINTDNTLLVKEAFENAIAAYMESLDDEIPEVDEEYTMTVVHGGEVTCFRSE